MLSFFPFPMKLDCFRRLGQAPETVGFNFGKLQEKL